VSDVIELERIKIMMAMSRMVVSLNASGRKDAATALSEAILMISNRSFHKTSEEAVN
jgi:hypothetical protein